MTNRTWYYDCPSNNGIISTTDEEILDIVWETWKDRMIAKYGKDSDLITEEQCILDWTQTYWAWEKIDDTGITR